MATKKPRVTAGVAVDWASPGSPQDLDELHLAAHGMLSERPDLRPSIARIMSSDLDADGRLRALGLFKDALVTPGDRNRDPRVAIEQCRAAASPDVVA